MNLREAKPGVKVRVKNLNNCTRGKWAGTELMLCWKNLKGQKVGTIVDVNPDSEDWPIEVKFRNGDTHYFFPENLERLE